MFDTFWRISSHFAPLPLWLSGLFLCLSCFPRFLFLSSSLHPCLPFVFLPPFSPSFPLYLSLSPLLALSLFSLNLLSLPLSLTSAVSFLSFSLSLPLSLLLHFSLTLPLFSLLSHPPSSFFLFLFLFILISSLYFLSFSFYLSFILRIPFFPFLSLFHSLFLSLFRYLFRLRI